MALGGEHPTSDHWASGWVASVGVALIALPAVAVLESIGPFIPLIFTKLNLKDSRPRGMNHFLYISCVNILSAAQTVVLQACMIQRACSSA